MPLRLRALLSAVFAAACVACAAALLVPVRTSASDGVAVLFWVTVTLVSGAAPIRMPGGTRVDVAIAPVLASAVLMGPIGAMVVAAFGTTELRELRALIPRGKSSLPWYGVAYNHAAVVVPAVISAFLYVALVGGGFVPDGQHLAAVVAAGVVHAMGNSTLTALAIAFREGRPFRAIFMSNVRQFGISMAGLAPLAWLMAAMWVVAGPIGILPFALPLYTTRAGYQKVVEIRDMFTQTVKSLAGAVDAKDPFTAGHSLRVQIIARDLGKEMGCSEEDLEALEWGGLLHDIGKIGVPDAVLLKQGALTRDERILMNAHPVKGEEILRPVEKLRLELPIIRHHHEWYNGSGYPDGLIADQIPFLARIMHVADSFEAMTAARPYRMTPLAEEEALSELRKFSGIQFDPDVVVAFERLLQRRPGWARSSAAPPPVRSIPLLGKHEAGAQPA